MAPFIVGAAVRAMARRPAGGYRRRLDGTAERGHSDAAHTMRHRMAANT